MVIMGHFLFLNHRSGYVWSLLCQERVTKYSICNVLNMIERNDIRGILIGTYFSSFRIINLLQAIKDLGLESLWGILFSLTILRSVVRFPGGDDLVSAWGLIMVSSTVQLVIILMSVSLTWWANNKSLIVSPGPGRPESHNNHLIIHSHLSEHSVQWTQCTFRDRRRY